MATFRCPCRKTAQKENLRLKTRSWQAIESLETNRCAYRRSGGQAVSKLALIASVGSCLPLIKRFIECVICKELCNLQLIDINSMSSAVNGAFITPTCLFVGLGLGSGCCLGAATTVAAAAAAARITSFQWRVASEA